MPTHSNVHDPTNSQGILPRGSPSLDDFYFLFLKMILIFKFLNNIFNYKIELLV